MPEQRQDSYPLLRQFREFYVEIARLRLMVELEGAGNGQNAAALPVSALLPSDDGAGGSLAVAVETTDATASRIWHEMSLYLDRKMYEVKAAASSLSHDILQELLYIMAAYADETFVCLVEWSGKEYWRDQLMELRLFRSQIAGQNIFRRIDRLLARQEYGTEELTAIYLMILALGFRGQYLHDPASIESYRRKLFDRLQLTNPDLRWTGHRMFPEAYRYTVTEGAPVRLPESSKWWGIVAAIVGAWLILSTIAWLIIVAPTRSKIAATQRLLNAVTAKHSTTGIASKWSMVPFQLQGNNFQLELPSTLPLEPTTRGSTAMMLAPVLLAVDTPAGTNAGHVQAGLSSGLSSCPQQITDVVSITRSVVSVKQVPAPEDVMVPKTTLFFQIDPGLSAHDLARHPTLSFPVGGETGVTAVILYVPGEQAATL